MCIICIDYQKGLLTIAEARRNLGEMAEIDFEHFMEIEEMLSEDED
jgi:hypothetical protein